MKRAGRKVLRVIFTFMIVVTGPYIFLYFFINEWGKGTFLKMLKNKYNIAAHLDSLTFSIPFRISLEGFGYGNVNFTRTTVDLGG